MCVFKERREIERKNERKKKEREERERERIKNSAVQKCVCHKSQTAISRLVHT